MAASYPTTVKSFTTKLDGSGNTIFAAHVNEIQDEIVAMESAFVTNGVAHALKPSTDAGQDLGTSGLNWARGYINELSASAVIEMQVFS